MLSSHHSVKKDSLSQQNGTNSKSCQYEPATLQQILRQNNRRKKYTNSQNKQDLKANPTRHNSNANLSNQHQHQHNSGIVRAQWRDSKGQLQTICYGTGVAISHRIVITCGHTIFLESKRKPCDSVTFIPISEEINGKIKNNQAIYTSSAQNFLQFQPLKLGQTFSRCPLPEDIALIHMSSDMPMTTFPQVGVESQQDLHIGGPLTVSGFPSLSYYNKINLREIHFQKVNLQGTLLQIRGNTIYHNMNTNTGHSGSGLFAVNTAGLPVLAGVHTHKGTYKNSGVYLSPQILKRLIRYEIQFSLTQESYKLSINFPQKMKAGVVKLQATKHLSQESFYIKIGQQQIKENYHEEKKIQNEIQIGKSEKEIQHQPQTATITHHQDEQSHNQILQYDIQQEETYSFERMVEMYSQHQLWMNEIKDTAVKKLLSHFLESSNMFFKLVKKGISSLPKANFNELQTTFNCFYESIDNKIKNLHEAVNHSVGTKINISKFKSVDQHLQEMRKDVSQIEQQKYSSPLKFTHDNRNESMFFLTRQILCQSTFSAVVHDRPVTQSNTSEYRNRTQKEK